MERSYEKLVVWKEADELCLFTYEITRSFPVDERFCLVQQMRKSSYSVPTNIVEGNARKSGDDRRHFMIMALASLEELHYQYSLALRLKYIDEATFQIADDRIMRVSYLLHKFHDAIN